MKFSKTVNKLRDNNRIWEEEQSDLPPAALRASLSASKGPMECGVVGNLIADQREQHCHSISTVRWRALCREVHCGKVLEEFLRILIRILLSSFFPLGFTVSWCLILVNIWTMLTFCLHSQRHNFPHPDDGPAHWADTCSFIYSDFLF